MTVKEWAETVLIPQNDFTDCYIAVTEGEDGFDLEVETDEGTIAGTFFGLLNTLEQAKKVAEELDAFLVVKGKRVYKTRTAWELLLFGQDD